MAVTAERLPRSLVAMEIEVEADRLEDALKKAVKKVSQQVRIPGFRPGKAPREIVERMVGHSTLLQEAIEDLLPDLYSEALAEQEIEAIDQPEIELKSTEPLVVSVTVPVRPTIDLGDYEALRVPKDDAAATPEQIDEAVLEVQRRFATLEPVDRAVAWGDTVRIDVSVAVEGQDEPHVEEGAEFRVTEGGVVSLPGFLDRLIDLERGGPHEFSFALPDDYEAQELAGKTASYTVHIHEVKQEVLPDLDDDFARSLDEDGIENLEQLHARVEETVRARVEAEAEASYRDEVIDLLLATADLDYPEVLVEREIDSLVDQQSNHASHERETIDAWLEAIGSTEDEVRDALREQADLVVRRGLVLAEFAAQEAIEVPEDEIEREVSGLMDQIAGDSTDLEERARVRGLFDTPEGRGSIGNRILTQRALERLAEITSQPDDGLEPRPARGRSRRRRGARGTDDDDAADDVDGADPGTASADADPAGDAASENGDGDATGATD